MPIAPYPPAWAVVTTAVLARLFRTNRPEGNRMKQTTTPIRIPEKVPSSTELAECLRSIEAEAEATAQTWRDIATLVQAALLFSTPEPLRPDNGDRHMVRWLLQEALNREFELTGACEVIGAFVDDPNVGKPGADDA